MIFDASEFQKVGLRLARIGEYLRDFDIEPKLNTELYHYGHDIQRFIKERMQSTPANTQRSYRRTKSGKVHYPSYPGNFPAIDRGNLATSIMFNQEGELALRVGATGMAPYAKFLEDQNSVNRPFLKPTEKRFTPIMYSKLTNIVMKAVKAKLDAGFGV